MSDSMFSKDYEGMWFLLAIPAFAMLGTVIGALIYKFVHRKDTEKPIDLEQNEQNSHVNPAYTQD